MADRFYVLEHSGFGDRHRYNRSHGARSPLLPSRGLVESVLPDDVPRPEVRHGCQG